MSRALNLGRYPPQEPLSALGAAFAARVLPMAEAVAGGIDVELGGDPYRTLTVFPAARPAGDVLVVFHGGGWTNGCKEWMFFMAPALNARGVTVVSAGYRLAPQHVFPSGFDDCADAVAWVLRNIGAHGGDAQRVFVGGHSAGGHLAALLATTTAWRGARGLTAQPLAGCLPVSGTFRFGEGSGLAMRPRFLGPVEAGDDPRVAEAAAGPLAQLAARGPEAAAVVPPMFVTWGSRDFPHLVRQAEEFVAALREVGIAVAGAVQDGCDHFEGCIACGDPARPWVDAALAWMSRQRGAMRPPTTGDRA